MRIAIEASTWVNRRGYGRFTRELTHALLEAGSGHRITLVLDSGSATATDLPGVPRVVVPTSRPVVEAAGAGSARSPLDLWRMMRALSSHDFDKVLFPTVYSFVPVTSRAHVTVVVHDALPETMPELVLGSPVGRLLWRVKSALAYRRADLIATVSEASARAIRPRLTSAAAGALVVLTEGPARVFHSHGMESDGIRIRPHVPAGRRFVLYVGGMSPHKRVPDLVRAFGDTVERLGDPDLTLVLVGPGPEDPFESDRAGVGRAIAGIGEVGRRVIRTGFVPDETLAALYRGATCVVLPSAGEGFGLPALEAMASGTPLLVSRAPALQELCGEAADYAEGASEIASRLTALLGDADRRERLARAGVDRARRFGWPESARLLLDRWDAAHTGEASGGDA